MLIFFFFRIVLQKFKIGSTECEIIFNIDEKYNFLFHMYLMYFIILCRVWKFVADLIWSNIGFTVNFMSWGWKSSVSDGTQILIIKSELHCEHSVPYVIRRSSSFPPDFFLLPRNFLFCRDLFPISASIFLLPWESLLYQALFSFAVTLMSHRNPEM